MRTIILNFIAIAKTSISHNGGEQNSITTQFRRESYLGENMKEVRVPVVSGNSIRGNIRDILSLHLLDTLGVKVSPDCFDLLTSGGFLGKGSTGVNLDKEANFRRLLPMLSILGYSLGNKMGSGKLEIGKMQPCVKEISHILPEYADCQVSVHEIVQTEFYTRKDDKQTKGGDRISFDLGLQQSNQMMNEIETIKAGTKFTFRIVIKDANDIEMSCIKYVLDRMSNHFNIGGNSRIGLGAISFNLVNSVEITEEIKPIDISEYSSQPYLDFLSENKEEIAELLATI